MNHLQKKDLELLDYTFKINENRLNFKKWDTISCFSLCRVDKLLRMLLIDRSTSSTSVSKNQQDSDTPSKTELT